MISLNTSPASGKDSQVQFFPLRLKFLSKVIILLCGLWGEPDGGSPLCSWYDHEESAMSTLAGCQAFLLAEVPGILRWGSFIMLLRVFQICKLWLISSGSRAINSTFLKEKQ